MCITYERAAVALIQITRESRYVFIWNAKKSAFHVNQISLSNRVVRALCKLSSYVDMVYCLKIIKQMLFFACKCSRRIFYNFLLQFYEEAHRKK